MALELGRGKWTGKGKEGDRDQAYGGFTDDQHHGEREPTSRLLHPFSDCPPGSVHRATRIAAALGNELILFSGTLGKHTGQGHVYRLISGRRVDGQANRQTD